MDSTQLWIVFAIVCQVMVHRRYYILLYYLVHINILTRNHWFKLTFKVHSKQQFE